MSRKSSSKASKIDPTMEEEVKIGPVDDNRTQSARDKTVPNLDLDQPLTKKNNFLMVAATDRKMNEEQHLKYLRDKESAEAMISKLNYDFRDNDPDKRLRVQAVIEKTISEAKMKINKRMFAKHLYNSKQESKDIKDSTTERVKNEEQVRDAFYVKRDAQILSDTKFDIKGENEYQAKCHHKFESNNSDTQTGWMPIIDSLNKNKQLWDLLILVMAIFNSFAVPLEYVVTELLENQNYAMLDLIINILFIFDIVIGFRTTYFDAFGMEVRDPKQLAKNYLAGMFVVDFMSSIPYRYAKMIIPFLGSISFLKILKIARISRFAPFVQKLEMTEEDKATLKIFQLLLILVLILHCLGCFWFIIVIRENVWAPPLDFIYVQRHEYNRFYDLEQVTQTYQFLCVLYLGVLALGGNEMGPRTDTEILAMFLILVTLILVNAYVFGQMSVLVSEASKKSAHLQKQVDIANTSMNNLELKSDTKTDIRMFLISTQGTQYEQEQLKEFFKLISPTLKEKVSIEIFLQVVMNNLQMRTAIMQIAKNFIVENPFPKRTVLEAEIEIILPIVTRMVPDLLTPDVEIITKLCDDKKALFLIAKGECFVDFRNGGLHTQNSSQLLRMAEKMCGIGPAKGAQDSENLKKNVLRQGQLFGEISLIYECATTASVIALKYCTIGKLEKTDFDEIILEHPQILKYVKEGIFKYHDKDMRFIKMALKQLPFFQHLQDTDTIFYEIIYSLTTQKKNQGIMLMNQGDELDDIYIVEQGIVEIYLTISGTEIVLERLFRGSVINYKNIFTEHSFAKVNMRFAQESVIKLLSRNDINKIRQKNGELNKAIEKFELKVAKIPDSPLDYIMMLPKKVYAKLIDRTREKMLFGKQDTLMEHLQERKDDFKKYQGLEMDDIQIAKTLKDLQMEMLTDQEVVHFLTKMNHLELRVKNVATSMLLKQQETKEKSNIRESLAAVIKFAGDKGLKKEKLARMDTSRLSHDGLVKRLTEKIYETQEKIDSQNRTLRKIQGHIDLLLPVQQRNSYQLKESPDMEFDNKNIKLAKK